MKFKIVPNEKVCPLTFKDISMGSVFRFVNDVRCQALYMKCTNNCAIPISLFYSLGVKENALVELSLIPDALKDKLLRKALYQLEKRLR